MGLFDFIFGGGQAKKQGVLFTTSIEIERTLFRLGTLNQNQRTMVKNIITKFLGSGGVRVEEYRLHVLPELYKMVQAGQLSSVDYQKLKSLIYK